MKTVLHWTSLVAQWLRICLPMQGTLIHPWSRKIPTCHEAISPWATTTEPMLRACVLQQERPPQREAWAPQLESRLHVATKTQNSPKYNYLINFFKSLFSITPNLSPNSWHQMTTPSISRHSPLYWAAIVYECQYGSAVAFVQKDLFSHIALGCPLHRQVSTEWEHGTGILKRLWGPPWSSSAQRLCPNAFIYWTLKIQTCENQLFTLGAFIFDSHLLFRELKV